MKRQHHIPGIVLLLSGLIGGATVYPGLQDRDRQEGRRQEEQVDPFEKWLNKDVVYIITPQEKTVFGELTTAEEKENFIEQFWRRRDTDPSTAFNEFKTEFYRRIAYANEIYSYAGIPGWKTDRGRVYITFGRPTSVERYSAGSPYDRPMDEGGGTTAVYPLEKWYYNHIEGMGSGIDIEFVDRTMTGGFMLALRPEEKDAMLMVDGAGLTLFERMGLETRAGRIRGMDLMRDTGGGDRAFSKRNENPFLRLERYFQLLQPKQIKFRDLQAAVATSITYNDIAFSASNSYLRLNRESFLVPITVFLPSHELAYKTLLGGSSRASVNLYGSVKNLGGRILEEFEDLIYYDRSPNEVGVDSHKRYQKIVSLAPGVYKLDLIVKDTISGKIGHFERRLDLPRSVSQELSLSALVLANRIIPSGDESLAKPFATVLGWNVYPAFDSRFDTEEGLGLYFEVYNYAVDQSADKPVLDITATVADAEGTRVREGPAQQLIDRFDDRMALAFVFSLEGLKAGDYTLQLSVHDKLGQTDVSETARFQVSPADAGAVALKFDVD